MTKESGVPYGSRTRDAAVKEERFTVIQRNCAAWIALYRTGIPLRGHAVMVILVSGDDLGIRDREAE